MPWVSHLSVSLLYFSSVLKTDYVPLYTKKNINNEKKSYMFEYAVGVTSSLASFINHKSCLYGKRYRILKIRRKDLLEFWNRLNIFLIVHGGYWTSQYNWVGLLVFCWKCNLILFWDVCATIFLFYDFDGFFFC